MLFLKQMAFHTQLATVVSSGKKLYSHCPSCKTGKYCVCMSGKVASVADAVIPVEIFFKKNKIKIFKK